jgi:succinate dehydrogenase / fumarate reductase cytochrome b subunit
MIAVCWHFSYGVWLFAAKWGITPGAIARKRFGYVCAAAGILLCVLGLASIYAFVGPNYQNAPEDVTPSSMLVVPFSNMGAPHLASEMWAAKPTVTVNA